MSEEFSEEIAENEESLIFSDEAYRQYLRFLSAVADKLVKEDIRERTDIDQNELITLSLLNALVESKDMKTYFPTFSSLLQRFVDNYLHMSISRKRKSRAEIIETVKSAFRAVEEKTKSGIFEKLLKE
jgi:hypothetical protein